MADMIECPIPYEKVLKDENKRIIFGAEIIGDVDGGNVYQSKNRNVITISHKGYFYHINVTDIVKAILDKEDN